MSTRFSVHHSALAAALGCAAILLLPARVQADLIVNAGFETGDFTGWSYDAGYASVVTSEPKLQSGAFNWGPAEGDYFAYVMAGKGTNVYSMVSQPFSASAGDVLSFSAFFDAGDYMPFNDDGFVRLMSGDTVVATLYAQNVSTVGDYGYNGWTPVSYVIPSSGSYTIQAGVENDGDNQLASALGLDNVSLAPVPEPSTLVLLVPGAFGLLAWASRRRTAACGQNALVVRSAFTRVFHRSKVISSSRPHRPYVLNAAELLLPAVLLAFVPAAWAGNTTYTIVDYPASQTDPSTGEADHVSGYITTDGTLGQIGGGDFVSASFTITTPSGESYFGSTTNGFMGNSLVPYAYATSTELLVPFGYSFGVILTPSDASPHQALSTEVGWYNGWPIIPGGGNETPYYFATNFPSGGGSGSNLWFQSPPPNTAGSIGQNADWVVGTAVPEPSTLILLGVAATGLLGYARRRLPV